MFINAIILESNLSRFPSSGGLNPPSNSSLNPNSRLLLLLFSDSGLLLPPPLKAPNLPNRLYPIVLKYKKCSSLIFFIFVVFY